MKKKSLSLGLTASTTAVCALLFGGSAAASGAGVFGVGYYRRYDLNDDTFWAVFAVIMVVTVLIIVGMAIFVYKDAKKNQIESPGLWVFICLIGGVIGLVCYIISRNNKLQQRAQQQLFEQMYAKTPQQSQPFQPYQPYQPQPQPTVPAGAYTYCVQCGNKMDAGSQFCNVCGAKLR